MTRPTRNGDMPADKFWVWLFRGTGGLPGYRRLLDGYVLLHVVVGLGLAWYVPLSLKDAASVVLFPLAGVGIGLAFAWGANAVSLMQTREIATLGKYLPGGLAEYAFTFQLSALVLLSTMVAWGLVGLGIGDVLRPAFASEWRFLLRALLYGASSVAIRVMWQVVVGTQQMLLAKVRLSGGSEEQE